MTLRVFFILFSIIGMTSTFLPWIHYPKANADFMGYMGDGIVSGILFFASFLLSLFSIKSSISKFKILLYAIFGLVMIYWSYSNHTQINSEALNFKTNNPTIALSAAGLKPAIGIYILGLAGLGILLTAIALLLTRGKVNKNEEGATTTLQNSSKSNYLYPLIILGIVSVSSFMILKPRIFEKKEALPKAEEHRSALAIGISNMGNALKANNYNTFIDYLHPFMIQSYGGRENAIAAVEAAKDKLKEKNTQIKDIKLSDVYDIKSENNSLQAIVTQQIIYNVNGKEIEEIQKLIAISDDNGTSWKYININGKTKAEMIKFFPLLNQKLVF